MDAVQCPRNGAKHARIPVDVVARSLRETNVCYEGINAKRCLPSTLIGSVIMLFLSCTTRVLWHSAVPSWFFATTCRLMVVYSSLLLNASPCRKSRYDHMEDVLSVYYRFCRSDPSKLTCTITRRFGKTKTKRKEYFVLE